MGIAGIVGKAIRRLRKRTSPTAFRGVHIFDDARRIVGAVDAILGAPMPIVRVFGWTALDDLCLSLSTTGEANKAPLAFCRLARPDVIATGATDRLYNGFRADFHLDDGEKPIRLAVNRNQQIAVPDASTFGTVRPHYEELFLEERVLRREDIYGSGPPTDLTDQVKGLLDNLSGKVLDFGCGNGDSLLTARQRGCDAWGLELETSRIQSALKPGARPYTTLYAGGVPLPFADASFDWIWSSEVIEHIDDIEIYVLEFARLLKPGGKLLVTTPDISSIPSSFPAGVVPWHLLESTHVRFFTPISLRKMLAGHFDLDVAFSLCDNNVNGWPVPGSTAGIFSKRA